LVCRNVFYVGAGMTDIEKRLEQVERFVELILVAHANPYDSLLNDKESEYVGDMQKRMGWRGYNIVRDNLEMSEATRTYDDIKRKMQELEAEYPALKGR